MKQPGKDFLVRMLASTKDLEPLLNREGVNPIPQGYELHSWKQVVDAFKEQKIVVIFRYTGSGEER